MNEIPRTITIGPFEDLRLQEVSYDSALLTCRVEARYRLHEIEFLGDSARTSGDLTITGLGPDHDSATEGLRSEIVRLTESTS